MISITGAATLVMYLIVAGLVFWLLWWLVGYLGLPEPINKIANAFLAILAVAVVIGLLVQIVGGRPVFVP